MNIEFRHAQPEDSENFKMTLNEALVRKLGMNDTSWEEAPFSDEEIQVMIADGKGHAYVTNIEGQPAGAVLLLESDARAWGEDLGNDGLALYIHKLSVRQAFAGRGVGEQIINWAAQHTKDQGRQYLRLDCHEDNAGLCNYYEKLGFQRVGTHESDHSTSALYQRDL